MGPSGPFTPWIQHPVRDGQCIACGLVPKAVCETESVAYTHVGAYLTVKPTGRVVVCGIKAHI